MISASEKELERKYKEQHKVKQIYRHNFIVPDDAIDENGHVNNLVYLRWVLDTALLHFDSQGSALATRAAGGTWIVRSHRIEYLLPAFAGEHISIWSWVSNIRRVQSLRKYKIFRLEDSAILAEGEINWVFLDAKTGMMRSIPKDVQATFEILPEDQEAAVIKLP
ncbi:MAG: acyl-CoA thioesterase [Deltaproteobacteria bacterium HGW-Deltaproteobacteria-12]|nr:MAG: acyl-CoA thioesterase [Deltaproteobacteria bacterium HGW-Deltaproteobacteria-12]